MPAVSRLLSVAIVALPLTLAAQPRTDQVGPQVGTAVPAFEGVDQFGRSHTLQSVLGPNGAMIVFYRSADW
jgi:hypothetical protein